jgi:hypothetical protein
MFRKPWTGATVPHNQLDWPVLESRHVPPVKLTIPLGIPTIKSPAGPAAYATADACPVFVCTPTLVHTLRWCAGCTLTGVPCCHAPPAATQVTQASHTQSHPSRHCVPPELLYKESDLHMTSPKQQVWACKTGATKTMAAHTAWLPEPLVRETAGWLKASRNTPC